MAKLGTKDLKCVTPCLPDAALTPVVGHDPSKHFPPLLLACGDVSRRLSGADHEDATVKSIFSLF